MAWTCSNCTCENDDENDVCTACDTAKEEEEEEYEGGTDDELEEEDELGTDLRSSQGFDNIVGGALAKENKKEIQKLAETTKKKLPNGMSGFLDYEEDNCVIRAAKSIAFLDKTLLQVWGVNDMNIIIELKFMLEDKSKPPSFRLYQTPDKDLSKHKLKEHSFGLEWQCRARMDDWLNGDKNDKNSKCNWPPKDDNWVVDALKHLEQRILNCTKTCIICDGPLLAQMIKPSVCNKSLCVHSYETYGLGADVASELRESADVVDLLVSFCYGASMGDIKRFNPYPVAVETKILDEKGIEKTLNCMLPDGTTRNPQEVQRIVKCLPNTKEMKEKPDTKTLKKLS